MLRLGLCCLFKEQPIKFRTTTASALNRLSASERKAKLVNVITSNADALLAALKYCYEHNIGSFRINSQILPAKTHPVQGYDIHELPDADYLIRKFTECGNFAKDHNIRTTFHPDQFVVLNSPRNDVVENSIRELEYQAEVAIWVNADVINIHGGGAYGDKLSALKRLRTNIERLSDAARSRLTLENDDKTYTPTDLYSVCEDSGIPLVYDVHHHRCKPDILSVAKATTLASSTWNREPLFHISSPRDGWEAKQPSRHHDYINVNDFPEEWRDLHLTIEVEAKAKELAVQKLQRELIRLD